MNEFESACWTLTGELMSLLAAAYSLVALIAIGVWRLRSQPTVRSLPSKRPAVSVLKPLYGEEPQLDTALRSFFVQDYPHYQLVFGVRRGDDPSLKVVRRLCQEYPLQAVRIVINPSLHGKNNKVSNLINILRRADHDILAISDSDIIVRSDYLTQVVAPLSDPGVGVVTCLYQGRPQANLWSLLGSLFVGGWFGTSVKVSHLIGARGFSFGASIAMRREALESIGGFESIRNALADDFQLGALTRKRGLRSVLIGHSVETVVAEPSFEAMVQHELRWMRTIRQVQPLGYLGMFMTASISTALIGVAMTNSFWSQMMLVTTLAAMTVRHLLQSPSHTRELLIELALLPVRDLLIFSLWVVAFAGRSVTWQDVSLRVDRSGSIQAVSEL